MKRIICGGFTVRHSCEGAGIYQLFLFPRIIAKLPTFAAIKFVKLCPEKCAVVFSSRGKVQWFYKSPDWWPFIRRDKKLDKRTLAYDFFISKQMDKEPVEIDADAWIESSGINEIVEHSIGSSRHGFVLSILWIRPN